MPIEQANVSMLEVVSTWISDHNNVTFAIAAIGFLFSIFNFIETRLANRKRIEFSIKCSFMLKNDFFLVISVINKSRLPITLTYCTLTIDGHFYQVGKRSICWFMYEYPDKKGKPNETTDIFPIKIEGLDYFSGTLNIPDWNSASSSTYKLKLGTNRGHITFKGKLPQVTSSYSEILNCLK